VNLEIFNLSYTYNLHQPNAVNALRNINLTIPSGQALGLLGPAGSGKSTLVQHLNGLLSIQTGHIKFNGLELTNGKRLPRELRQKIGLVFQFAEFGFFEENVFDEVAFSPRQWGWSDDQINNETFAMLERIGFPLENVESRSPFQFSGGQQRLLALASVLVMNPEVLILDEPTVGLDALARRRISEIITSTKNENRTVIIISHDLDFIAPLVDRIVILKQGRIISDADAYKTFSNQELLQNAGLEIPSVFRFRSRLQEMGITIPQEQMDVNELKKILRQKRM
jgi:energy-coupling factor transport system ATP-binding protein